MKITQEQLKMMILEVLEEASRDPQVATVQKKMINGLNELPKEIRYKMEPLYRVLLNQLSAGQKDDVKSSLEALSGQFQNFIYELEG